MMKIRSCLAMILVGLLSFFSITCCSKHDKKNLNGNCTLTRCDSLISPIEYISNLYITNTRNFVSSDYINYHICEFDSAGHIIKEVGNYGKGPNEFSEISCFSQCGDFYVITDRILNRATLLDEELNFLDSFLMKDIFNQSVHIYKDKIVTFGRYISDFNKKIENFYIDNFYDFKTKIYLFSKINIDLFPKYFIKKNFMGVPKISTFQKDEYIFIYYAFYPKIIKLNLKTYNYEFIDLDFPNYINPLKINFEKYKEKFHKKYHFPVWCYCYSPYFFWFDNILNIYIIQFYIPFQFKGKFQNKFELVLFDENFKYLDSILMNEQILQAFHENKKTCIITTELLDTHLQDYEEPENFYIYFNELNYED